MKIIDNILWIEFADFLAAGWKEDTLKKANLRNGPFWIMTNDPADRRRPLVQYETLRDEHKHKLNAFFGNVYDVIKREPIKAMVKPDHKAQEYFLHCEVIPGKKLPAEHVQKYSRAASWLNMLVQVNADKDFKRSLRKNMDMDVAAFYENVCSIIASEGIDLPSSYKRLRAKMQEYQQLGYECLVDWRFGNQLAAKVKDEVSEAVLLEMIALPNQHDDVMVCRAYNQWAEKNGYKTITPATVGNIRRQNEHLIYQQRYGLAAFNNKYGKVIHRKRPSAPLLLVGSDDNDLDLYFRDERKGKTNHYFRFKLIVVMDAHNDYILGYAYGETPSAELVKAAYLDAMYHIKELTKGWYLMDQIQTDRFAFKALEPFYSSLATYTPATAKVARAKYIERAFGTTWHQVLKLYPNYAGTNITSQFRINRENLDLQKSNFPTLDQAPQIIEDFINRMRLLPDSKTNIPKQQMWLQNFHQSELSQQHQITDARMLHLFGSQHSHTHKITNGGLKVTINGQQFVYDIPDDLYLQNVGKTVQVTYDPYDYSRVLVTDGANLRFVAREFEKMSGAIADYQEGERNKLNNYLKRKMDYVMRIGEARANRESIIERQAIDSASMLQASVLVKEIKQKAELDYQRAMLDDYDPTDM